MIALALFPLSLYFFFLTLMTLRQRPTVLSGTQDFMILACGLFGLFSLGPGKLLVPMKLLSFWGISVWFFWAVFYLVICYLVVKYLLSKKLIVYNIGLSELIPKLIGWGQQINPQFRLEGNVMNLPTQNIQCSLSGDRFGGHVLFTATSTEQSQTAWGVLQNELNRLLDQPSKPCKRLTLTWGCLSLCCFLISVFFFVQNSPKLLDLFLDYWI